jgi:hypothetical protein
MNMYEACWNGDRHLDTNVLEKTVCYWYSSNRKNVAWASVESNLGFRGEKPLYIHLSYDTASLDVCWGNWSKEFYGCI